MIGHRPRQQGFTLLELLVAFAIMAVSLGMLYRASGGSARQVGDIGRYQHAVVLGQSLLSLRDTVPEEGWNQSGESASYQWSITSAPYATAINGPNLPLLHEVKIVIAWKDAERQRLFELHTLRPQRKPVESGQLR
ncbi:MAG: prepilin-type N-terminal cleavage/methylation domain-containing protein [Giesbergeria sp.]|nr:prepilin-type N-terminal cleavage/methylation domain-containing protein [Giesbergeria sp.]